MTATVRYTLGDVPIELEAFLASNAELYELRPDVVAKIRALRPGEGCAGGGENGEFWFLRCESDEVFRRCACCGRSYSRAEFDALAWVGEVDDGVDVLVLRNCACGATYSIKRGDSPSAPTLPSPPVAEDVARP